MTKYQLKVAVLEAAKNGKANKALQAQLDEILTEYATKTNRDTEEREWAKTVDGVNYRWCNRHERYEVETNFDKDNSKRGFKVACKLAAIKWRDMSKEVKTLQDELLEKAEKGEEVQEVAAKLKDMKEKRAGRYDIDADLLQYEKPEGYLEEYLED